LLLGTRLLAVGCLTAASLGALGAAAPPGQALIAATFTLNSGSAHLLGGGHTWDLSVSLNPGVGPRPIDVGIGITAAHRRGQEIHSWNTSMPSADFTFTSSSGSATIDSHADLSPLASLTLKFTPVGHRKAACATGAETIYTGTLKGSVKLVTGLHGLTLKSSDATFRRATTLEEDFGCLPPHPPCAFSSWTGPVAVTSLRPIADGYSVGRPGKKLTIASVVREVRLKAPTSTTTRADVGIIKARPPKFSKSSKTLRVTSSSSGIVTGSARLKGVKAVAEAHDLACTLVGKTYKETVTGYRATFRSPAGHRFEAHTLLSGTIKVGLSGKGEFTVVSLKRK
jgi:hypothetical protein